MTKSIVISCGPIPARIDSVKLITNKFKGGLALKTARALSEKYQVTIVAHEGLDIPIDIRERTNIVPIKDVFNYFDTLKELRADAFILAGAVANLTPINPWEGKFPSHDYKEGDVIPINFTIAPRSIDRIRKWHPKATLIGYKLFDGTEPELISAGKLTLRESGAHAVFCNHPKTAKSQKIALTQDGATIPMDFERHLAFISQTIGLKWYRTQTTGEAFANPFGKELTEVCQQLSTPEGKLLLGCAAYRHKGGFITTARGKTAPDQQVRVEKVDHAKQEVTSSGKATLNAPTLAKIFERNPEANWILHGHTQLPETHTQQYTFPGTTEDVLAAEIGGEQYNSAHHGYYAAFQSLADAKEFLSEIPQ